MDLVQSGYGSGEIENYNPSTTVGRYKKMCHGCGGRGWVKV